MSKILEPDRKYVCGFMFDPDGRVLLVQKLRPDWQAGKLNGIGGRIEDGESGADAMRREFLEETGIDHANWSLFCVLKDARGWPVLFYEVDPDVNPWFPTIGQLLAHITSLEARTPPTTSEQAVEAARELYNAGAGLEMEVTEIAAIISKHCAAPQWRDEHARIRREVEALGVHGYGLHQRHRGVNLGDVLAIIAGVGPTPAPCPPLSDREIRQRILDLEFEQGWLKAELAERVTAESAAGEARGKGRTYFGSWRDKAEVGEAQPEGDLEKILQEGTFQSHEWERRQEQREAQGGASTPSPGSSKTDTLTLAEIETARASFDADTRWYEEKLFAAALDGGEGPEWAFAVSAPAYVSWLCRELRERTEKEK